MTPEMAREDYEALWNRCEQLTRERDNLWTIVKGASGALLDAGMTVPPLGDDLVAVVERLTRERDDARSLLAQYELVMTQDDHKLVQDLADAQSLAKAFMAENARLRALLAECRPWVSTMRDRVGTLSVAEELDDLLARLDAALKGGA